MTVTSRPLLKTWGPGKKNKNKTGRPPSLIRLPLDFLGDIPEPTRSCCVWGMKFKTASRCSRTSARRRDRFISASCQENLNALESKGVRENGTEDGKFDAERSGADAASIWDVLRYWWSLQESPDWCAGIKSDSDLQHEAVFFFVFFMTNHRPGAERKEYGKMRSLDLVN